MSESLPQVSIALTTYNGAPHLAQQLDSLLAQEGVDFEIVAADDGSSDDTPRILARYAARDARLRVLATEGNLGFNGNFARCFAACRAPLISPCDQDDVWAPHKTARLLAALGDAEAVYSNSRFVDASGQPMHRCMSDEVRMLQGRDPRAYLFGNSVSGHAMLFRRGLLAAALPFPKGVYFDWWLAFVAAGRGGVRYLDEVLVDYRRHPRAVTCQPQADDRAHRRRAALEVLAVRLAAMAAHAGPQQAFMRALEACWWDWYRSLVGWGLFRFMLRHAAVLFEVSPLRRPAFSRARRYLIGYRLKNGLLPRRYPAIKLVPPPRQTAA